ncbi:MAG: 30S ribosomal protein S9 [Elusimicrobiales bacterium]|nr:30S ribosomal protein S9 [Elusimicrobiales bacterium]HPO94856.1 30S ribosomal protein S9 [Elusimicrobiales bacterium]
MEKILATGRRKTSTAKVFLIPNGSGKVTVNDRDINTYFGNNMRFKTVVISPFDYVKDQKFDCSVYVKGGGISSQAGAIRHAIARAIAKLGESFHHSMKKAGFLTRDPRMVERKKPGKPKARKRFQFSKR